MPGVTTLGLAPEAAVRLDDHVGTLSWSADGHRLAAGSLSGAVVVLHDGAPSSAPPAHGLGTGHVAWAPDAPLLATGGQDGVVRVWDADTGEVLAVLQAKGWCGGIAWRPDGRELAAAVGRAVLRAKVDGSTVVEHLRHDDHPSTVGCLAWTPDGRSLGVGAYGGLWWYQGAPRATKHFAWKGALLTVAVSPDGRWVASGNQDASVHCWKLWAGDELAMSGFELKVEAIAWSPDAALLAVGNAGEITLWGFRGKGPRGQKPVQLAGHARRVVALGFGHGGRLLATAGAEGRLCLWDHRRSSERMLAAHQFDDELTTLAWAPDGRRLAVATDDGTVWTVDTAGVGG